MKNKKTKKTNNLDSKDSPQIPLPFEDPLESEKPFHGNENITHNQFTNITTEEHFFEEETIDNTEVYDEVDLANLMERNFINAALQRNKEKLVPETHPDFDGESCILCGDEIPKERLSLGKIRCIYCQTKLEKQQKQKGF